MGKVNGFLIVPVSQRHQKRVELYIVAMLDWQAYSSLFGYWCYQRDECRTLYERNPLLVDSKLSLAVIKMEEAAIEMENGMEESRNIESHYILALMDCDRNSGFPMWEKNKNENEKEKEKEPHKALENVSFARKLKTN